MAHCNARASRQTTKRTQHGIDKPDNVSRNRRRGGLAGLLMKGRGFGLIGNIIVGIIGAFIGGFLASVLGLAATGIIGSIILATAGAAVLLFLIGLIKKG
jgi:uncharacterized membrane protein YeaQ/YmgE (transglycosylase-associated protein family)